MLFTAEPIRSADQPLHHVDEASVDLADHIRRGNPDVGEEQLGDV